MVRRHLINKGRKPAEWANSIAGNAMRRAEIRDAEALFWKLSVQQDRQRAGFGRSPGESALKRFAIPADSVKS
jgi:hypothetical protein